MNSLLKICSFFFLSAVLLSTSACNNDDDNCVAPGLEENIVGTWDAANKLGATTVQSASGIVFNADGTLIDNDFIISGEANGVVLDQKTWSVLPGGDKLEVRASSGTNFVSAELELVDNQCDFISLEIAGLGAFVELSR